ncbi:MAG: response regulator [Phaeodactylibacter sp.]|nr:response regulator [Phaeodactylibacter sp.]
MRITSLVAFFVFTVLSWSCAQPSLLHKKLHFSHLSLKDGLSQSTVLCSWQDRHGFLWFGTRDGLNRYDGYSFEVYRNEIGNPRSLGSNVINEISEDKNGNLWIATDKGLSKFSRTASAFENFSLPPSYSGVGEFYALLIDSRDNIWVGNTHGLFLFDATEGIFRGLPIKTQAHIELTQRPVYALREGPAGRLWAGTSKNGVYSIDIGSRQLKNHYAWKENRHARVEDIVISDDGSIWAATYGDGLYLLDSRGEVKEHYHTGHREAGKRLANNNIRALEMDDGGNLWIGTFDGLDLLAGPGSPIRHVRYVEGDATGLSHSSIRSISRDSKGSLWIGTYFGGVNIFDFDNQRFSHFHHIPGDPNSLSYNVTGAFSETASGNLAIGTERGGLNIFDEQLGTYTVFTHIPGAPHALSGNIVKALYTDEAGSIWIGVFKGGLNRLDPLSGEVQRFPAKGDQENAGLRTAVVNTIVPGPDGKLWIATDGRGGLHCFSPSQGRFIPYPGSEQVQPGLGAISVKSILIARDGRIWLATRGAGIALFDPRTGSFQQIRELETDDGKQPVEEANHIYEDKDGALWISTHGSGVLRLAPASMKARHYYRRHGLSNDIVFGALEDNAGQLWFFTLNGPSMFHSGQETFKSYPYNSGFPIEEINEGAFYKTRSGEFVVGGNNGYVRFGPTQLSDNTFVPPVVFTHLKLSNKEVLPGDEQGLLSAPITETGHITLTYFQSVATFEFAALSYLQPENNRYAYLLEGFSDEWSHIGNKRSVTFTNLPEGDYTLKVKGSNNDGVWNEAPATLKITVLPPPWKTWWAFVLYAIAISGGFLLIRYNALKGAQLKHDLRVEQLEKEKWKEVHQLKLQYFTDVSHEFRTPLTLIANPLEEILERKEGGKWLKKRIRMMYYNTRRLLLLIDQILEIRELETGHSRLRPAPVRIETLIGNVVDSFKALADKKNIRLVYAPAPTRCPYLADTDKLEKIFFNLLSNSFKFTPSGGEVRVDFSLTEGAGADEFRFEVSDTGPGISQEHLGKIFDRFYTHSQDGSGAGIGLSLTRSLVNLLGGRIEVESQPGAGTSFFIRIPLERMSADAPPPEEAGPFEKPLPLEYIAPLLLKEEAGEEEEPHSGDTLLIVEDNKELRAYLEGRLKKQYQVIIAPNGRAALEQARKHGPALVVSDIMMSEMDGLELCRAIKADPELCHIPVILLTAKSSQINRLEGLELGADDYIAKPFIMKELETRIRNILENRRRLREKYQSTSYLPDLTEIAFNSYDEKLLRNVVAAIEANLGEPSFTVADLSREVGLSRVQLFRKLKSLAGLSPVEFIRDFRMKRAAQLLTAKNVMVSEVAYEVGFQDVQYFSKCFRKAFKMTPSRFMKERQAGQEADG